MTGSLRLSALLLLLLSRWAYTDLEKGEDEYVRSWVIIEEQLVPPSRDELLAAGSGIAGGGSVSSTGRRITPKSVFVAPSFNKCSDGYRPDSMGRCVKVVKLNQAAQWDFLIKQLNSMYGAGAAVGGGGVPMPAASAFQPSAMTTTTAEPSLQKTDSPGPFQLNIPLAGGMDLSNQMTDSVDEQFTTSTSAGAGTTITEDDRAVSTNPVSTIITTIADDDDVNDHTTVASITTNAVSTSTTRPRPYRNRHQTQTEDNANTVTPTYDSQTYSTIIATDMKTKYVDSTKTSTVGTDDSLQTTKTTITAMPLSSSTPNVVTTTAEGVTDIEGQITTTTVSTLTTTEAEEEDVVTVLAVAATADSSGGIDGIGPSSTTRLPSTTTRIPYTTSSDEKTQHLATNTVTPEYYDDQPEDSTSASELDCLASNAYLYYPACASLRQQQQFQQQQLQKLQQKQLLLQQHQQQQQQIYQQQQQFYHPQQLQQQNPVATTLMKRPTTGGGVQVRFPEEEDPTSSVAAEEANLVRFPGLAPYRTTNKMYESSRHPTWWPTGWPEQQQSGDMVHRQHQKHRIQHHIPQQQQDPRLWEFGSRLPKSTTTTTAVPPTLPPTQWFHRFF